MMWMLHGLQAQHITLGMLVCLNVCIANPRFWT